MANESLRKQIVHCWRWTNCISFCQWWDCFLYVGVWGKSVTEAVTDLQECQINEALIREAMNHLPDKATLCNLYVNEEISLSSRLHRAIYELSICQLCLRNQNPQCVTVAVACGQRSDPFNILHSTLSYWRRMRYEILVRCDFEIFVTLRLFANCIIFF